MWADGGGKIKGAATRPLSGPYAVGRFVMASLQYLTEGMVIERKRINGEQAILLQAEGHPFIVVFITVNHGAIQEIRVIGNPEKLAHLS
jgi:RNA polymerase sigma-70 factor (ECF subfamily)